MPSHSVQNSHLKLLKTLFELKHPELVNVDDVKKIVKRLRDDNKSENYIINILNTLKSKNSNLVIKPRALGLKTKRNMVQGQITPDRVEGIGLLITYAATTIGRINDISKKSHRDTIVAMLLASTTTIKGRFIKLITFRHLVELFEKGNSSVDEHYNNPSQIRVINQESYNDYFYNPFKSQVGDFSQKLDDKIITSSLDSINKFIRELYVQLSKKANVNSLGLKIFHRLNDVTRQSFLKQKFPML